MDKGVFAVWLGVLLFGQALAATPEQRHGEAVALLKSDCGIVCGYGISSDPRQAAALDALWAASQDWTLDYLNAHPAITADTLETELLNRSGGAAPASVVPLAPDLYAFTANWGETGTVFLAEKRDGHFALVWNIRQADSDAFPILAAWRSDAAVEKCRKVRAAAQWGECGPLFGTVHAMKADAQQHVRFAVAATYAQLMGMTVAGQLSIWQWDGSKATAQLARTYTFMNDDGPSRFTPQSIAIREKDEFRMFFSCGACVGRQLDWTIALHPDRIEDLGTKPVVPELDVIDELLFRVARRQPAFELASPEAIAALTKLVEPADDPSLGAELDRVVAHTVAGAVICLSTDALPLTRFVLERRGGGFFVSDARQIGAENNGKCG